MHSARVRSRKLKRTLAECMLQTVDELPAKDLAENLGWEKGVAWMDPPLAIGRKAAGGHHAMNVGMVLQVLPPGVQDAEETDLGAQVAGVGRHLQQSLSAGAKQQVIDGLLVVKRPPGQFVRQCKDHMEVADRDRKSV